MVVLRDLGGGLWEVVESYSDGASIDPATHDGDHLDVAASGPAGLVLQLSAGYLDGEVIGNVVCPDGGSCQLAADVEDKPVLVRLSLVRDRRAVTLEERRLDPDASGHSVAPDDPTLGEPGDSPKDVAERFMREVLDDESVTMAVEASGNGHQLVTMETSTGAEVVAEVAPLPAAAGWRLVRVASPGISVNDRDRLYVLAPDAVTLTVSGYDAVDGSTARCGPRCAVGPDLSTARIYDVLVVDASAVIAGTATSTEIALSSWLRLDLVTEDGRVLRYFSPR